MNEAVTIKLFTELTQRRHYFDFLPSDLKSSFVVAFDEYADQVFTFEIEEKKKRMAAEFESLLKLIPKTYHKALSQANEVINFAKKASNINGDIANNVTLKLVNLASVLKEFYQKYSNLKNIAPIKLINITSHTFYIIVDISGMDDPIVAAFKDIEQRFKRDFDFDFDYSRKYIAINYKH